ncbi:hypothetical protein LN042_10630 [Kitasatospora sp. RB6PN24]|uniref:DUF3592 domain-containing protein n=1 Tax=Kitasatospora humi TaxID=2893891 RepID=UPI001E655164|nr:DUF3592 domain-containing protein [Kitasatospora humi]MCC9307552.1 hypothetical protein [Kitasatospora humi]
MAAEPATVAGGVLVLFGGALLFWCAAELRLRHRLRRNGVPVTALVVPDTAQGQVADSAPLLSYATLPARLTCDEPTEAAVLLSRPRGTTTLSRPIGLLPGSSVRVCYDPRRPARVVLTGLGTAASLPMDVFWTLLGTSSLAGGLSLLAIALRR